MKILKLKNTLQLAVILSLVLFSYSCDKSTEKFTYVANVPIYMDYDEFRATAITFEAPMPLENTGKIYFKGGKIYVNELFKGIHVIDNSDPTAPNNIGFISIPGNVDIAIKGNILYVDSYIDLLAIDISNINNPQVTTRLENVFEPSLPPSDETFPVAPLDHDQGVVIDWKIEKITEKIDVTGNYYYGGTRWLFTEVDALSANSPGSGTKTYFVPNAVGVAGSMARFIIFSDYLYTINAEDIKVFNISNTPEPQEGASVETARIIETLFVYNDNLFVGSTTGMLIYSLGNPANPTYLSMLDHFRSCDPVVVEGDYAYVTLRAGSGCGSSNSNQLDVVNIANITSPYLVKSYSMTGPYGLGIDNDVLFICDGDDGLKVFDATDKTRISNNMIKHFPAINAFDIIPYNNLAMMIGSDGLYQYNYSDLDNMELLSVIPIVK